MVVEEMAVMDDGGGGGVTIREIPFTAPTCPIDDEDPDEVGMCQNWPASTREPSNRTCTHQRING